MSTELTFYDKFSDSESAVRMMGESIAMSKLFNCESVHQGNVIAMECLVRRIPPLMLAQRYHLIKNKLSMQADAMLAEFDMVGKHRLIERSPERAAIELDLDGKTYRFELTWEQAQAEPFVYEGKEADVVAALAAGRKPPIKPKYATPRARMQMLWARVVSDSVTAIYPGAKSGCYTPEEVDDFQGGPSALPTAGDAEDAEFTPVKSEDLPAESTKAEPAIDNASGMCTASMSESIKGLFDQLGMAPEVRSKAIAKRNPEATTLRQLTAEQADDLHQALAGKVAELLAARIKQRLAEIEQEIPGISAKAVAKLKASGLARFVDLPREKALELLSAMASPQTLEQFFGVALWSPADSKKLTGPAMAIARAPALAGLAERFAPERIWRVGLELFGFPPTLQLATNDLLTLQNALEKGM